MGRWAEVWANMKSVQVTLLLSIWVTLFTLGVHVNTESHLEVLQKPVSFGHWCGAFFVVTFCYTLSNVGFLCLIASWAGSQGTDKPEPAFRTTTRGFLIYLLCLAGVLVISQRQVATPDQDRYIWLAGVSSAICFISTYQPQVFDKIISSFVSVVETVQDATTGDRADE